MVRSEKALEEATFSRGPQGSLLEKLLPEQVERCWGQGMGPSYSGIKLIAGAIDGHKGATKNDYRVRRGASERVFWGLLGPRGHGQVTACNDLAGVAHSASTKSFPSSYFLFLCDCPVFAQLCVSLEIRSHPLPQRPCNAGGLRPRVD